MNVRAPKVSDISRPEGTGQMRNTPEFRGLVMKIEIPMNLKTEMFLAFQRSSLIYQNQNTIKNTEAQGEALVVDLV